MVTTFDAWRTLSRKLLSADVAPDAVDWSAAWTLPMAASASAHADALSRLTTDRAPPAVPSRLLKLLDTIALFRGAGKWEFMYRLTWRVVHHAGLLEDAADADVHRAAMMEKAVNRDVHKMHAFVRFREVDDGQGDLAADKRFFAWFEPAHVILRRAAVFFVKRFPNMHWTIATPDGTAVWDLQDLTFVDAPGADAPGADALGADAPGAVAALGAAAPGLVKPDAAAAPPDRYEPLWRAYYRNICNVARINPAAMQREMPRRYWQHLPEAVEIEALIRRGPAEFSVNERESDGGIMVRAAPATGAPTADETPQTCRRCELWKHATQAVPGEGSRDAQIVLVGEQPGDEEDLRGHAFIGPAGKVLDLALQAAGLDRRQLFITNAVKHFKWEPRGKRRLHKKPSIGEIKACNIWLGEELADVKPGVIVALGATALRALTGQTLSIDAARRQQLAHSSGARILATYHPSAVLRAEGERIEELRTHLVADLKTAAELAAAASRRGGS